jgi:hypothetical protein
MVMQQSLFPRRRSAYLRYRRTTAGRLLSFEACSGSD